MKKYVYKIDPRAYTKTYYFDETYSGSKQYKEGLQELAPTIDHIYRQIPFTATKKAMLDAGCGKGEFLLFMKKKGYSVFGIDYSTESVKITKKLLKKYRVSAVVKRKDVRDTMFPDSQFDYVISTDVIEHMDDNNAVVEFLNEAHRVLKKGGTLYIHTAPNSFYVDYFQKYYLRYINYIVLILENIIFHKNHKVSLDVRSAYEKKLHINEQSYFTLLDNIKKSRFRKFTIELFADPYEFNLLKLPYYCIAYFYPLNKVFPFSLILANHIYLTAKK